MKENKLENTQKPIILLVGKSGSGKNYFTKFAKENMNMDEVISRTTREPRYEGEDTHLFVSMEQAEKETEKSLAYTYYCGNHYYVLKEDLVDKAFYVIDSRGVETFKNSYHNIPYLVVYYNVPWWKRAWRMLKRGDSIRKIIERLVNDHKDFNSVNHLADIIVTDMPQLVSIAETVKNYAYSGDLEELLTLLKHNLNIENIIKLLTKYEHECI